MGTWEADKRSTGIMFLPTDTGFRVYLADERYGKERLLVGWVRQDAEDDPPGKSELWHVYDHKGNVIASLEEQHAAIVVAWTLFYTHTLTRVDKSAWS